jgi:hypothetical protein
MALTQALLHACCGSVCVLKVVCGCIYGDNKKSGKGICGWKEKKEVKGWLRVKNGKRIIWVCVFVREWALCVLEA